MKNYTDCAQFYEQNLNLLRGTFYAKVKTECFIKSTIISYFSFVGFNSASSWSPLRLSFLNSSSSPIITGIKPNRRRLFFGLEHYSAVVLRSKNLKEMPMWRLTSTITPKYNLSHFQRWVRFGSFNNANIHVIISNGYLLWTMENQS